ncbi:cytokinin dehydrogenase 7-like [Zingiber officinale]|uniref:cytokinin dehydrogenase 7-like n=1 Tax=Zingiber officinale TaxID=94328 RepID=UPI001C4C509A|nr:cytokinin dehydrogenase 7-like [Zingiber officinale]
MAVGILINLLLLVVVAYLAGAASAAAEVSSWLDVVPSEIASKLDSGSNAAARFATDYGGVTRAAYPAAVFQPSTADDIAALLRFAYCAEPPFPVAARGNGHSVRGQALAPGGVALDMAALGGGRNRINVSSEGAYVDAGGEQLWIDVLEAALRHGLSPRSWTDYLYLTVGGTLSNAGISGQVFRHGPQISNVYELDVITGKGEMITCSSESNRDLFYGVLGGLGQLGVITRARISLRPAPARVRWLRLFYTDLGNLTRDQEFLISLPDPTGFDYVEGQVLLSHQRVDGSTFYSNQAVDSINRLKGESNTIYFLEGAVYYDSPSMADQKIEDLMKQLNFVPGLVFSNDVTYLEFLNRVHNEIEKLSSSTVLLHPWLNLFLPKSRIRDFQVGVFGGILQNVNHTTGPILLYPLNKHRWNDIMTATVPDEEVFYTVGFLWTAATVEDWGTFDALNNEILGFCDQNGIEVKQYLPHYTSKLDWARHFGLVKWEKFVQLKRRYDPKALLSPGQQIFTTQVNTQEGMHAKL